MLFSIRCVHMHADFQDNCPVLSPLGSSSIHTPTRFSSPPLSLFNKYQQSLVTLCSLIWYELSKASHVAAVIGRSATCDTQMFSYLSLDSKQNNSVVIRLLIQLADRYKFFHTVIFTTCRNFHSHASCFKSWWNCFFSSIKPTEWCFLTLGSHMFLMCILMVF